MTAIGVEPPPRAAYAGRMAQQADPIPGLSHAGTTLAEICERHGVLSLGLFGSAARGEDDPARSDLDLLVRFRPMPPAAYADAYFGLKEALEAATGRPVDLVTESALENPHFRRQVEAEQRLLFAAS